MELIVITNNINTPEDINMTNKPILRKNKILGSIEKNIDFITLIKIREEIDIKWLECVHNPQYLQFLKYCHNSFILSNDISWANDYCGLVPCNFTKIIPDASVPIYKFSGFYGSDTMTPIYENTYRDAMVSANQAYHGANYLHDNNMNLVYVLATSPGHHAKKSEYGGYCFINNAVVAAQRLIELSERKVGILDVDYHAGNGTYEITLTNKNIVAYSLHCDPTYDYPSFDGLNNEHNYILPPQCDWDTYKNILVTVCNKLKLDNIDALIIAFGGDTFKDDPDAIPIGRFDLDLSSYTKMAKLIKHYFKYIPTMITQEGGYNMDYIGDIVSSFIMGLAHNTEDDDIEYH